MTRITFTDEELYDAFEYLDNLRDSGVTNMWGGAEFVARRFKWDDDKAGKALLTWMKLCQRSKTMDQRVAEASHLLTHEV